ncbi:MAG: hypothetical protein ACRBB0_16630 [Pelagimonas sp.]|uniref:hypothetical protein n=1 Tax=Pelagimonas sp. TaxID=2073170 RepID=UPI003D6B5FE7
MNGPKHGGAAVLMNDGFTVLDTRPTAIWEENAKHVANRDGFEHPLFQDGDPRAGHMLRQIWEIACASLTVGRLSERLDIALIIDAALVTFAPDFGDPQDATFLEQRAPRLTKAPAQVQSYLFSQGLELAKLSVTDAINI